MNTYDIMRKAYYCEWEKFISTGECDVQVIRPVILESWKRCRSQGLDPFTLSNSYYIADKQQFDEILRADSFLLTVVKPYMDILTKIVEGTGFIGMLANKDGFVLQTVGNPALVKSAEPEFIRPGVKRTEDVVGTTGISLCLISRQPVQIFSVEHYYSIFHDWTCSSAPIYDDVGELIGVLNLSGNYRLMHKHTLGIVISLAKAMEHAIKLRFTNTYLRNCSDNSEYGMAILDNKYNVKHLNKILTSYSSYPTEESLGKPVNEILFSEPPLMNLLARDNAFFEKSIVIRKQGRNTTLLVNTQSLFNEEGERIGKLIVTKEKKEIHRLVHRMVGAYATFTFENILGKSEKILRSVDLAKSVAPTSARVLIQGESGTGKELFAQAIHNASNVRDGPFIGINCSAIPSELMESELFGYNEGAFSGAKKGGMPGKFELADGGTIFLDEINSMPQEMQIKLLRVLEENKITRVGGDSILPINVRIIAASGKNLGDLVKQGRIRLDLYYRINTIILDIPPLRERKEDIPLLAEHFVNMLCHKLCMKEKRLSLEFIAALMQYEWPGNVRELGNVLERTIIIAKDAAVLTVEHLDTACFPKELVLSEVAVCQEKDFPEVKTLRQVEQQAIEKALILTNNNYVLAAKLLGVHRNTLYNKLKKTN